MNSNNKITNTNIYETGQTIGLNKKDINSILNDIPSRNEQACFAAGPVPYLSSMYGAISIKDF